MYSTTVINERKWLTSGNPNLPNDVCNSTSELMDPRGFKCCLGFECTQCGIDDDGIKGVGPPSELAYNVTRHVPHLINKPNCDSHFSTNAMDINDHPIMTYAAKKWR